MSNNLLFFLLLGFLARSALSLGTWFSISDSHLSSSAFAFWVIPLTSLPQIPLKHLSNPSHSYPFLLLSSLNLPFFISLLFFLLSSSSSTPLHLLHSSLLISLHLFMSLSLSLLISSSSSSLLSLHLLLLLLSSSLSISSSSSLSLSSHLFISSLLSLFSLFISLSLSLHLFFFISPFLHLSHLSLSLLISNPFFISLFSLSSSSSSLSHPSLKGNI